MTTTAGSAGRDTCLGCALGHGMPGATLADNLPMLACHSRTYAPLCLGWFFLGRAIGEGRTCCSPLQHHLVFYTSHMPAGDLSMSSMQAEQLGSHKLGGPSLVYMPNLSPCVGRWLLWTYLWVGDAGRLAAGIAHKAKPSLHH